jgi:hypothetical protein
MNSNFKKNKKVKIAEESVKFDQIIANNNIQLNECLNYKNLVSDCDIALIKDVPMRIGKDVAVVIHTCDKYDFLWAGWNYYFQKNWKFRQPNHIYFMNEHKPIDFPFVQHLPTGTGQWSDRLKHGLKMLDEEYVFYLQEDFWPVAQIDLQLYFNIAKMLDADVLRIAPDSLLYTTYKTFSVGNIELNRLAPISKYLVSHQASLWRKDFFLKCLKSNESPWVNEIEGTERLAGTSFKIFLSPSNWYIATCTQGKLTDEGLLMNQEAKLNI